MTKKLHEFNIPYDRIADESKDLIVSLSKSNIRSSTPTTKPVSVSLKYPHNQETIEVNVYLAASDGGNIRGYITQDEFCILKLMYYKHQSALANVVGEMADIRLTDFKNVASCTPF